MLNKIICRLRGHKYVDKVIRLQHSIVTIGVCSRCDHGLENYYMCLNQSKLHHYHKEKLEYEIAMPDTNWYEKEAENSGFRRSKDFDI